MQIRNSITASGVVLLVAILILGQPSLVVACPPQKPNIVLINIDDADTEMFSVDTLSTRFPNLYQLSNRSVRFTNVHATTPLCGPSRACLLRAQYAHHCGIRVNQPDVPNSYAFDGGMKSYIERGYMEDDLSTWMQDAGYHTMQVGKFLHHDIVFTVPEGWDDFYSSLGALYFGTFRITNRNGDFPGGENIAPGVYRTDAETADAVALINRRADASDDKPFFLYLNPFGPHAPEPDTGGMIDPKYASLWPNISMPTTDAYNEADLSDLTGPIKAVPSLNPSTHARVATHYRERMLAMKSVDDMVGEVVNTLRTRGLEDNTYVFVTSDNGFSSGQHRILGKGVAIDRATNIPLLVAGPGVNPAVSDHLLAHIDVGPTIVQLAGGSVPNFVDGVSYARLIADPNSSTGVRESVLIENFEARTMNGARWEFASTGLRMKNAIYVEWASGGREYFNLKRDPMQLENIYSSIPETARRSFANRLRRAKRLGPAQAGFLEPYHDLDELSSPYVLRGMAESAISTRQVKLAIRDLSTGDFWDGEKWTSSFQQVTAELDHPNAMLSTWELPIDFGDAKPAGLIKSWVWGLDYTNSFAPPDVVTFRLGKIASTVTLQSPVFSQHFSGAASIFGEVIDGDDVPLEKLELRIHDVSNNMFWNETDFVRGNFYLPIQRNGNRWSYTANLPPGSYRASINGRDRDGKMVYVTHRLFHVDP